MRRKLEFVALTNPIEKRCLFSSGKSPPMYMHDKLLKARGIVYTIGFAVVVVTVLWKLIVR